MKIHFPEGPMPSLQLNDDLKRHLRSIAESGVPFRLQYENSERKDWKCPTFTSK
jgi:hypothetical protein